MNGDWYFDFLDLEKCWQFSQGGKASIAVLDTGIDTDSPYPVHVNAAKSIDITGHNTINDADGHGTMCAAAIKGKGDFIRGIAPQADLQVIRAYENVAVLSSAAVIKGLQQAIENKPDIISMSLELRRINSAQNIKTLTGLIHQARENEIIMVCAIGNRSEENAIKDDIYLGLYDDCFSVGSVNQQKLVSEVTVISHNLKILVPGENIRVIKKNNEISIETSTSIATAIAAGLVGLQLSYIRENNKPIRPYRLLEIIRETGEPLEYLHEPSGEILTYQLFNPLATLQYLKNI